METWRTMLKVQNAELMPRGAKPAGRNMHFFKQFIPTPKAIRFLIFSNHFKAVINIHNLSIHPLSVHVIVGV